MMILPRYRPDRASKAAQALKGARAVPVKAVTLPKMPWADGPCALCEDEGDEACPCCRGVRT